MLNTINELYDINSEALYNKERIQKLDGITTENDLIKFVKINYMNDYKSVFELSFAESVRNNSNKYFNEFDESKYEMHLFKNEISKRLKIDLYYDSLEILKIIILFENILPLIKFDNSINKKSIKQMNGMYLLFIDLIGCECFILEKHKKLLNDIGIIGIDQNDFCDEFHSLQDLFARIMLEKYLTPYFKDIIK